MNPTCGVLEKRSKLGKWLDKNGIPQKELEKATQLNKNTISKTCNDPNYIPSQNYSKTFKSYT